jgi:hypothetical protein
MIRLSPAKRICADRTTASLLGVTILASWRYGESFNNSTIMTGGFLFTKVIERYCP